MFSELLIILRNLPLVKWCSQRHLIKKKGQCGNVKALRLLVAAVHPCLLAQMNLTAFSLSPSSPTFGTDMPPQMQISGNMHLFFRLKSISLPGHWKTLVLLPWLPLNVRRQMNNSNSQQVKLSVWIGQSQMLTLKKKKKLIYSQSRLIRWVKMCVNSWLTCFNQLRRERKACGRETFRVCLHVNQTRRTNLFSEQVL